MDAEHDRWMTTALDEARAAPDHGDVPVGAVVIRDGEVIAARHNERELTGDPVAHAEVLALQDAAAHIGHWRLDDCTLVVTLEPCAMCAGAMVNARLGTVVFGATDPKAGAVVSHFGLLGGAPLNHAVEVIGAVRQDECGDLLRDFFRARR
ncbi:tRNA adenosine(34) deaminase TadA [Ilumatobacter nonamiensis]|uniref:tRNA adenosine(34) deaminase TadA n=1 Tax=Ilumatobacter nonamiensis TaxID=467093 RepID=UPI00058FC7D1